MAVAPGINSEAEQLAAVALLNADLAGLLAAKEVPRVVQAKLALKRVKSMSMLAVLQDTRAGMRVFCKDSLGLDEAANPDAVIDIATVVDAWEAAKLRVERRNALEAEASVSAEPKAVPKTEHMELRSKFEKVYMVIEDKEAPAYSSVEDLFEQVDQGEFRFMSLNEFASREDADQEKWGQLSFNNNTGIVKVKKGAVDNPLPAGSELLRRRLKLVGHHWLYCKLRYPLRRNLQDIDAQTFIKLADYLLGELVSGFGAKDEKGNVVSKPTWDLILSYEFQIRKEATRRVNAGALMGAALAQAMVDISVKERYFTTPVAICSISASGGQRERSRTPSRRTSSGSGRGRGGGGGFKGGKGGGKGGGVKGGKKGGKGGGFKGGGKAVAATTPDGRQICFAWNNPYEKCKGGCDRVHCCRICFEETHPMHMHDAALRKKVPE
jgi:hypothetical protein